MNKRILLLVSLSALVIAIPIFSQAPGGARPSFEVATVKPNISGTNMVAIMNQPGGRFVATGVTLKMIMTSAYRVRDFQIIGGPSWIGSDRWNIEAQAEEGSLSTGQAALTADGTPGPYDLRVQSLLEDRFQLKFHRETRELPTYDLTVAKDGPKIKRSEDQTPFRLPERGETPPPPPQRGGPMPRGNLRIGRGDLEANAVPFMNLVLMLSQMTGRNVIDKTNLTGLYDFKLQWTPELGQGVGPLGPLAPGDAPVDPNRPSIFTAVQEQLGLKLESSKGPVQVLVIDSVQKPSDN